MALNKKIHLIPTKNFVFRLEISIRYVSSFKPINGITRNFNRYSEELESLAILSDKHATTADGLFFGHIYVFYIFTNMENGP